MRQGGQWRGGGGGGEGKKKWGRHWKQGGGGLLCVDLGHSLSFFSMLEKE